MTLPPSLEKLKFKPTFGNLEKLTTNEQYFLPASKVEEYLNSLKAICSKPDCKMCKRFREERERLRK